MTSICANLNTQLLEAAKHFTISDLQQWFFKSISSVAKFYLNCSSGSSMSFYVDPMTGRVVFSRDLSLK